jgi:hypothetical protein
LEGEEKREAIKISKVSHLHCEGITVDGKVFL